MEESWHQSMDVAFGNFYEFMLNEFKKMLRTAEGESSVDHNDNMVATEYKMAIKKVEFPEFDGDDPVGCITRDETYFEVQGSSEEVKVRLVKVFMEGATIH